VFCGCVLSPMRKTQHCLLCSCLLRVLLGQQVPEQLLRKYMSQLRQLPKPHLLLRTYDVW
jgi:hypothetical protein